MLITNIMLAFIAAGIFKIAHTLTCMEVKTKITIHTKVMTERSSDISITDVATKLEGVIR